MKFRTLSRIIYLKRARHRRGHGIHSPFLFQLITKVIENRKRVPEYKIFRELRSEALRLLAISHDQSSTQFSLPFNLSATKPRKFYRKIELQLRYGKVVFRLIREFNPSSALFYGPTLGIIPAIMSMGNKQMQVYLDMDTPPYRTFCDELLKNKLDRPLNFLSENKEPPVKPELIVISYPFNPLKSLITAQKHLGMDGDNDLMIIRGIHESKEMEKAWQEIISVNNTRISLDLFEIGIVLFRKGLQKQNFIHRF